MAKKKDDPTVSEDRKPQTVVGGVTPTRLKKAAKVIDDINSQMAELRGDMGSEVKDFEEQGGNKQALKVALKIKNMETNKARDFWNCLESYMEELGIFAQHELFPVEEISSAPKPGDEGAAPSIGSAQADVFSAAHGNA